MKKIRGKKQKMWPILKKKTGNINWSFNNPDDRLAEKDFKESSINIFKDIKEDICVMSKMMKNLTKEIKTK